VGHPPPKPRASPHPVDRPAYLLKRAQDTLHACYAGASAIEDQMLAPLSLPGRQQLTSSLRACIDALS